MEIVSGTADPDCPTTSSDRWTYCLGYPIKEDYKAWNVDSRVAGGTIQYDGLTFSTVTACGHTIPTYCPEPGLVFWKNFLSRTPNNTYSFL